MKKYVYFSLALSILISFPLVVSAQQGTGQGTGDQLRVQDPATHDDVEGIPAGTPGGTKVQDRNQVNTQNQGVDTKLKVKTNNADESQFGAGRSEIARQHMSEVSKAVEGFLSTGNKTGGIGQQVSEIAKQQQQAQEDIEGSLDKMQNRSSLMRTLFGYSSGAVKDMKKLMEQNQMRIQQLEQLATQTQNQAESTQLKTMIEAMVAQNTALQDQVLAEESTAKGLFGWLTRLFE